jgi:hypothetical protein
MASLPFPWPGRRRGRFLASVTLTLAAAGVVYLAGPSSSSVPDGQARVSFDRAARAARGAKPLRRPFFRAAYGGYRSTGPVAAREGMRYRVMILTHDGGAMIHRLKARNRNLKVLMYVDMMGSDTRDPTGESDWQVRPGGAHHADWFLRGLEAALVFRGHPTGFVMDVGDSAYRTRNRPVTGNARTRGFDGVFRTIKRVASRGWSWAGPRALRPRVGRLPFTRSLERHPRPCRRPAGGREHRWLKQARLAKWNEPIDGAAEESFTDAAPSSTHSETGVAAEVQHALGRRSKDQSRSCGYRKSSRGALCPGDDAVGRTRPKLVLGLDRLLARGLVARVRDRELARKAPRRVPRPAQRRVSA